MMRTRKKSLPKHRSGAMAVFAVFCLVVAMVFLAFSADWGYITVTASELQNAADAGALSGARALPEGREAAVAAAQLWAAKNVAARNPVATVAGEDVEIGIWNDDTASFIPLPANSAESPNAVRVTCRRTASRGNALNLLIAPVIGIRSADLTATATAMIERDRCGLVVGLDFVDIRNGDIDSYDSAMGSYSQQSARQDGNVCSDGPITLGPVGKVAGNALPGNGHSVNRPVQVTGSTSPRSTQIKWKPIDMSGVDRNNNDSIPSHLLQDGKLVLRGNDVLLLDPGTYYFPEGIDMTGNSSLQVSGPTRIVTGGSSRIAGTGIVNTTQLAANLRIDITDGSATFIGNSALHADIYGPTADLAIQGNAGVYGAVFGKTVQLGGNASNFHGDEALLRVADETARSKLKE